MEGDSENVYQCDCGESFLAKNAMRHHKKKCRETRYKMSSFVGFVFLRVIWPTYDTYCDIGLSLYCVYHDLAAWGIVMTLPIIFSLATSITAYIRVRRAEIQNNPGALWSSEGFALPLLIWPQLQASKIAGMIWRERKRPGSEPGWMARKQRFEREHGTIESIVEAVAQSFIAAFIIIQKYVEKNPAYGYLDPDVDSSVIGYNETGYNETTHLETTTEYRYQVPDLEHRDGFGIATLFFIVLSAVGSLISGIFGLYGFLLKGPLKIVLGPGFGNNVLLFCIIVFGLASRFGSLAVVFMFSTALEPSGFWLQALTYICLVLGFIGIQLIICLIPLMSFKPMKFLRLVFSFPHILIVPLVTPFTYGLVCSSGCRCHCCCCCGCPSPCLALSRRTSLANHLVTLLLMVPPVVFFDFISSWDLAAAQLAIGALGLVTAPLLLLQPGRIIKLGVLDPDCLHQQLLGPVEGSSRWGGFRLGPVEEEEPLEKDEEEGNEAEKRNLIAVHSPKLVKKSAIPQDEAL